MTDAPLPPALSGLSEDTARTLRRYARAALIGPEELADRVLRAHFRTLEAEAARPTVAAPAFARFTPSEGPLLETFLRPRLVGASDYGRISGYFRSTALLPVRDLLERIPRIRLLCNAELDPRDIDTARMAGSFGDGPLPEGDRFRTLFDLLRSGRLEVRVVQDTALPFLHGKAGLIRYPDGRARAFIGSVNDTHRAWTRNYELLWEEETPAAAEWVEAELDRLWPLGVPLSEAVSTAPVAPPGSAPPLPASPTGGAGAETSASSSPYDELTNILIRGFPTKAPELPDVSPEPKPEPDKEPLTETERTADPVENAPKTAPQEGDFDREPFAYPKRVRPVYSFRDAPPLARAEVLETSWLDRSYSRPELEAIIDAALYRLCRKMSATPKQDMEVVREHVGLTVKKRQEPGYQHSPTTGLYYPRQSVEQALRISDRVARVIDLEFRARVSDEVTGETFTLTSTPEEVPVAGPETAVTVRPGSCVEYETADPVTGKPKRMRVFIMRSPDDVIGEDGVQSIGNATPVAKALLDAEVGEEVFLDGDAPQARPLKVLRVW